MHKQTTILLSHLLIQHSEIDSLLMSYPSLHKQLFLYVDQKMIKHFKSAAPKNNVQWEAFSFRS